MKVITQPTVEVVAHTKFVGHPSYKIPPDGDDAVRTCAFAAKGCYDSYGEQGRSNQTNQETIISSRHGSVLEHFSISLFIEGITRGCSLELNRHRHFSISQRSTRYTAEEDAAIVLDPYYAGLHDFRSNHVDLSSGEAELLDGHLHQCELAIEAYQREVERLILLSPPNISATDRRKWARGKARNLLPHALETRGTWTGNLRAWRHFIELRTERHAEAEIRRLASMVFDKLAEVAPFYFDDYDAEEVDGINEWSTENRKV